VLRISGDIPPLPYAYIVYTGIILLCFVFIGKTIALNIKTASPVDFMLRKYPVNFNGCYKR
jgi:hypothetical protein